jgi:hypothetical protein
VPLAASAQHARAIEATGQLLTKLRVEFMFVGSVARAAWLGGSIDSGSIDVVAIMQPQQKTQVAMMAHNNGFRVERDEVDAAEELDLVPMWFEEIRVHVLVASNALYARMMREGWFEGFGEHEWRIPSREDLALLSALQDDEATVRELQALPEFDRARYNERVTSIGLRGLAV